MDAALSHYRNVWQRKPILHTIYDDFYDRIAAAMVPGATLEIGGGIGSLRDRLIGATGTVNIVTSDIQFAPWLDCVADAQYLPFNSKTFDNFVMVDVCHHLEFPAQFFAESARVLRPGGRIIMIEPAITWGSALFYRLLHEEPVRTSADPLAHGTPDPARDPYLANQAIPTLIATREAARFHQTFPNLSIGRVDWFSFAVYPLSGGFKPWSLIPARLAARALRFERALEPVIGRFMAFRMMIIIDKTSDR